VRTGWTVLSAVAVCMGLGLWVAGESPAVAGGGRDPVKGPPAVLDERDRGYVGPDLALPPQRPWEGLVPAVAGPLVTRTGSGGRLHKDRRTSRPQGFLAGKTLYLSPGHGFTYDPGDGRFECQRPNSYGLVEDLSNAEAIIQFLIPYLWSASALVVPVREVDMTHRRVVLDDADGGDFPADGLVEDQGDLSLFSDSTLPGYGRFSGALLNGENPFEMGGNRLIDTSDTQTASVQYTFAVPEAGFYNVYVSFSSWTARASDAHYIVLHPGGEAHFRVDQRHHGGTWVLLGRFWFALGQDPTRGAVILANDSADAGSLVSADGVRIGGGLGIIDRGGGTSGWPRYTENSRFHAQYSGAPTSVYDLSGDDRTDDVGTRSRFAAWVNEVGEDSAYFSWHTNAGGGTGTSIYIYWPNAGGQCDGTDATAGSADMADLILAEVIGDVRAVWDPGWTNRGRNCAWFGEVNPSNNGEMPAALLEAAFHDLPEDVADLKEPRFRRVVARAVYQGIVRYFAQRDGVAPQFVPEPPTAPAARNVGLGRVEVSWRPPASDAAGGAPIDSYRLFQGPNGLAFDEGVDVGDATATILEDLAVGEVRFFRITGVNAGGESLPSSVVGVMASPSGRAPLLIVDGFDRNDAGMLWAQDTATYLGTVDRMVLSRMHDPAAVRRHGPEAAAYDVPFDSAHHVSALGLPLEEYDVVDYLAGRGVYADRSMDSALRTRLDTYVATGGNLLVSGSHVATHLFGGDAGDVQFLAQVLYADGAAAPGDHDVTPATGELLDGVGAFGLHDGEDDGYDVGPTDGLIVGGSGVGLADHGGGGSAAVRSGQGPPGASVLLGFPLEGVVAPDQREEIMGRILAFFEVEPEQAPDAGSLDASVSADASPTCRDCACADSGCGCASASGPRQVVWPLLALGLFLGWRRRRQWWFER
jgi:MYXO-CTERM domain-containing protein